MRTLSESSKYLQKNKNQDSAKNDPNMFCKILKF